MRVVLNSADPTKVDKYVPLLSGGVPNDVGLPDGPNPLPVRSQAYRGRPVDIEQLRDGSVLVSDDFAGLVYRIA